MPKVSVIIPAYNRAQFLPRAIDSVLAQTYKDFEVLVVDDGSTDDTKKVLEQYNGKIKYFYKDNGGSSSARNHGIENSSGEYIAFLDSDDIWMPEKLSIQVDVLDKNKNVGLVYSRMPIIDNEGKRIGYKPQDEIGRNFYELLHHWGDLPTSTVLTRKQCFDRAGLFDIDLLTVQDIDMWLRIAKDYDIHECKGQELAHYFRHGKQNTSNRANVLKGLLMLNKKIVKNYKRLPNFPCFLYWRKIAKYHYWLSREYYDQEKFAPAFIHLIKSILRYPIIGHEFYEKDDAFYKKMYILVKPYGYVVVCFIRFSMQGLINLVKKENLE